MKCTKCVFNNSDLTICCTSRLFCAMSELKHEVLKLFMCDYKSDKYICKHFKDKGE